MPAKKRAARKAAGRPAPKRQKQSDDPLWCVQSEKSPLVHDDLHALYSNPKTYEHWTKQDWEEARQTLPDDAPYNEDGYSVPLAYFKHDVEWRRYVREFQEDLGAGRYDPEWQKQARQAMEERARGDFDKYKADQFEEFWGQKQKTHSRELAGESAQIKLEELVKHGVMRVGDIFSYSRVFGKGKDRFMVEKDARVVKIEGASLTLGIPPRQLKYARYLPTPEMTPEKTTHDIALGEDQGTIKDSLPLLKAATPDDKLSPTTSAAKDPGSLDDKPSVETSKSSICHGGSKTNDATSSHHVNEGGSPDRHNVPENTYFQQPAPSPEPSVDSSSASHNERLSDSDRRTFAVEDPTKESASRSHTHPVDPSSSPLRKFTGNAAPEDATNTTPSSSQKPVEDVILVTVTTLTELERHMCAIDARCEMQGWRSINSWKAMRAKRDNQDMGSLFDIREDFYINISPTIVKEPQTSRSSGREIRSTKHLR